MVSTCGEGIDRLDCCWWILCIAGKAQSPAWLLFLVSIRRSVSTGLPDCVARLYYVDLVHPEFLVNIVPPQDEGIRMILGDKMGHSSHFDGDSDSRSPGRNR